MAGLSLSLSPCFPLISEAAGLDGGWPDQSPSMSQCTKPMASRGDTVAHASHLSPTEGDAIAGGRGGGGDGWKFVIISLSQVSTASLSDTQVQRGN